VSDQDAPDVPAEMTSMEEKLTYEEYRQWTRAEIRKLPGHYRLLLERYLEGWTFDEIAEICQVTRPAIDKRFEGAVKLLKAAANEHFGPGTAPAPWEPEIWVLNLVADMLDDPYMKARDDERATLRETIRSLEQQREWDRVALADMVRNERHLKAKLQTAEARVAELEAQMAELKAQLAATK